MRFTSRTTPPNRPDPTRPESAASPAAILALIGATAEWRVGQAPTCLATVRLLDHVDFAVHVGECVVVHHDDPAGVRVLLAALSGHPRLVNGGAWRGARDALDAVRIRRSSIRADLVAPIVGGWRVAVPRTGWIGQRPTVHLLRASRSAGAASTAAPGAPGQPDRYAGADHRTWREWAADQRRCGGAIVIVADTRGEDAAGRHAGPPRGTHPESVWERPASYLAPSDDVRECLLRNGRLVSLESTVPPRPG
jgi:hypothetical protein